MNVTQIKCLSIQIILQRRIMAVLYFIFSVVWWPPRNILWKFSKNCTSDQFWALSIRTNSILNFQYRMEGHFLEFLEKRTTLRGITKFSENSYRGFPFHFRYFLLHGQLLGNSAFSGLIVNFSRAFSYHLSSFRN